MADLATQFGERVRRLRGNLGLTQARLAEAIGTSVEWVRRIEQGKGAPSFDTIAALATALGVAPADLFGGHSIERSDQIAGVLARLTDEQAAWLAEGARLLQDR